MGSLKKVPIPINTLLSQALESEVDEVAQKLLEYVERNGGQYKNWYAGIASNEDTRLFVDHNVDPVRGKYQSHKTSSAEIARKVEKRLLEYEMDGGRGGGDDTTIYVYAYLKTGTTRE